MHTMIWWEEDWYALPILDCHPEEHCSILLDSLAYIFIALCSDFFPYFLFSSGSGASLSLHN